jgi:hypothetical protein
LHFKNFYSKDAIISGGLATIKDEDSNADSDFSGEEG